MDIVEVGPRDGLQNEAVTVPTAAKLEYVERLIASGLRRIETVSFAHPARVPQMADAEAVMAAVVRPEGVSHIGLVMNERGMTRAIDAGVNEANVVLVASETFSQRNQGSSISETLDMFESAAPRAIDAGIAVTATIGASFGCPFEGEVATTRVQEIARRAAATGAQEIALADTIGVGVPNDVERLVTAVREVTDLPLRLHLHNTRNTGYANASKALELGVDYLDSSSGGIGGCPFAPNATGNVATEDLAYLLGRSGVDLGLDAGLLVESAGFICAELGIEAPALLGRAGWFPPSPNSQ